MTHCSAGEDVVDELVGLDAVPLFARVLPPTVAQEEGVVDFPLANGQPMLKLRPTVVQNEGVELVLVLLDTVQSFD